MSLQYRGRIFVYQRADRPGPAEYQEDAKWVESRNGMPLVKPYVWRGPRSRFAALTRSRIELRLAASEDG